jgi:hypothetical protein
MTYAKGDIVSIKEHARAPRLRGGACSAAELDALTVVATKDTPAGVLLKLTTRFAPIGWEKAVNVVLVRRGS